MMWGPCIVTGLEIYSNLCGCYSVPFYFMFSNFNWLDLHEKMCVALTKLWWSINQNWIDTQTSSYLVVIDYEKPMFVDFFTEHI